MGSGPAPRLRLLNHNRGSIFVIFALCPARPAVILDPNGTIRSGAGEGVVVGLRLGQRVWVVQEDGRAFGRIASLPAVFLSDSAGFVVLLDGKSATCVEELRGSQWDVTDREEEFSSPWQPAVYVNTVDS
jgi:hypothetical protein